MIQTLNDAIEIAVQETILSLLEVGCSVDKGKVQRIRAVVASRLEADDRPVEKIRRLSAQNEYRSKWRWKKNRVGKSL